MPRLSSGYSDHGVLCAQELVDGKFVRVIEDLFKNRSIHTVVLSFDDSSAVASYKSMTQTRRIERTTPIDFHPSDPLPDFVPPRWSDAIANRAFKQKVISYLCGAIPPRVAMHGTQRLIVDYKVPSLPCLAAAAPIVQAVH